MQYIIKFGLLHARLSIHARLKIDDGKTFAVFLDNIRVRFGVFKDFFAESILYKFSQFGPGRRADALARGRERDDEFAIFIHNAERPDAAIKGFVFALQEAAAMRVQESAGNFFFGVVGAVVVLEDKAVGAVFLRVVNCAELPHHTVFVGLAEFFGDFRREKRGFPKALPPKRAAEFAGGALTFGEDGGKHISQGDPRLRRDDN